MCWQIPKIIFFIVERMEVNVPAPVLLEIVQRIGVTGKITLTQLSFFLESRRVAPVDVLTSLLILDMVDLEVDNGMKPRSIAR